MSDIRCRYPKIIGFQLTDSVNILRQHSHTCRTYLGYNFC